MEAKKSLWNSIMMTLFAGAVIVFIVMAVSQASEREHDKYCSQANPPAKINVWGNLVTCP